ncbi:hypothetical protein PTTG_29285 [Puccinia triticina 1-1 BBBD Race 1]|uniref:Uncharacterized protein n=1 Tax=Puccinia triticina (isolate 1-1 / race 1 (BBBD)) TaxID=630390 RepID=A0A180G531_PUCT1|nr:hypothetical protein PTTG_29285 [Puccinia triticina 1-1 BBBD Race 1]
MSAASALVYWFYHSRPHSAPLNHLLAPEPAPTEDLFPAAIINKPRVVEEEDTAPIVPYTKPDQVVLLSCDETEPDDNCKLASALDINKPEKDNPSSLGAPPIVPNTKPDQVVLLSCDKSEPADDLESLPAPDTHQPVQLVESPAEEEAPNPNVGPPLTRLDKAAATEDKKNGTDQPVSLLPERRLPPPDYVFWTPVFAHWQTAAAPALDGFGRASERGRAALESGGARRPAGLVWRAFYNQASPLKAL